MFSELYLLGQISDKTIRTDPRVSLECEKVHSGKQLQSMNNHVKVSSDVTCTVVLLNTRSLNKQVEDVASHKQLASTDIISSAETQIKSGSSVKNILEKIFDFSMHFNNCQDQYQNLAYCFLPMVVLENYVNNCQDQYQNLAYCFKPIVVIENCVDYPVISLIKFSN